MAVGGLTPDVKNVFSRINKGPFAGLAAAAFLGLCNAYPDFGQFVQDSLAEAKKDKFNEAGEQCFYADVVDYAGQDIFTYFKQGDAIFNDPLAISTIREGATMGLTGTPRMPIFAYKSINDEISPIADTDALLKQFCDAGVSVEYVREQLGEHFTLATTSVGDELKFLKDRFAGKPVSGCITRDSFNTILDPGNLPNYGPAIVGVLLNAAGAPAGALGAPL